MKKELPSDLSSTQSSDSSHHSSLSESTEEVSGSVGIGVELSSVISSEKMVSPLNCSNNNQHFYRNEILVDLNQSFRQYL